MTDIKIRMNILKDSGTLSQKNYDNVIQVIKYFKDKYNIELTEENASAFVTHLCMALERADKGEPVEPLDRGVYEAASQEPTFAEASACSREIREILPQIPDVEAEYICMHVGVMLAALTEHKKEAR
jgi:transcriptional antiterminator